MITVRSFAKRLRFSVVVASLRLIGSLVPRDRQGAFWVVATLFQRLGKGGTVTVRISPERHLKVRLDDPYWTRLLMWRYTYEPELAWILKRLRPLDYDFIDGGANIGYWTILLSSKEYGAQRITAIEASRSMTVLLRENVELNGLKVQVRNCALSSETGRTVALEPGSNHSGTHIATSSPESEWEKVETVTLDDVVRTSGSETGKTVVIKLDIEGAEVSAFTGAQTLLHEANAVFLYEDHGKDSTSEVTEWLIRNTARAIYLLTETGSIQIKRSAELAKYKTNANKGYNMAAVIPGSKAHSLILGAQ